MGKLFNNKKRRITFTKTPEPNCSTKTPNQLVREKKNNISVEDKTQAKAVVKNIVRLMCHFSQVGFLLLLFINYIIEREQKKKKEEEKTKTQTKSTHNENYAWNFVPIFLEEQNAAWTCIVATQLFCVIWIYIAGASFCSIHLIPVRSSENTIPKSSALLISSDALRLIDTKTQKPVWLSFRKALLTPAGEYQIHWRCNSRHFFLSIYLSFLKQHSTTHAHTPTQNLTNWRHINLNLIYSSEILSQKSR